MNLQQLEYIVALDKFKSFSKAAEACFVTQATLSTMVKRLEEELDMVIFDRKTSPILTTDCGQEIVAEAQKMVFHAAKLKQMSAELKGKIEGEIRLGVIPTIAGNLLGACIPHILSKYPGLKLKVKELTTANIIAELKSGELDAGIVSTPLQAHEFEEIVLYYEKLAVYGRPKVSDKALLSPFDIQQEQIWLLEDGNCLSDQIVNLCSLLPKHQGSQFDFSPSSFDSLLNIVDSMGGLTLLPELFYLQLPPERKAKLLDFEAPFPVREVSLIYHRPYAKLRLVEALSREIQAMISPILQTSKIKNSEMLIAKM